MGLQRSSACKDLAVPVGAACSGAEFSLSFHFRGLRPMTCSETDVSSFFYCVQPDRPSASKGTLKTYTLKQTVNDKTENSAIDVTPLSWRQARSARHAGLSACWLLFTLVRFSSHTSYTISWSAPCVLAKEKNATSRLYLQSPPVYKRWSTRSTGTPKSGDQFTQHAWAA